MLCYIIPVSRKELLFSGIMFAVFSEFFGISKIPHSFLICPKFKIFEMILILYEPCANFEENFHRIWYQILAYLTFCLTENIQSECAGKLFNLM